MTEPPNEASASLNMPSGFTPEQEAAYKEAAARAKESQRDSFHSDGMEIRTYVLHVSLTMEKLISELLAEFLGIDVKESHVLGHRSMNISFNQKVRFLIEMGKIEDPKEFTLFQMFMEIRNTLMHNLDARTLTECFAMISEKEKKNTAVNRILAYAEAAIHTEPKPVDGWTEEQKLDLGVRCFYDQIFARSQEIIKNLGKHKSDQIEAEASIEFVREFQKEIREPVMELGVKVLTGSVEWMGKRQAAEYIRKAADAVRQRFNDRFSEIYLKHLNKYRQKMGFEALETLPTDEEPLGDSGGAR